jgi:pseudaminic acid cytidylyltransferase
MEIASATISKKKFAIIPARGGSKRIPRKNVKQFCGQPMIAYAIKAAQESGLFERIIVSTDDHEIAALAVEYGAEVPFLRSKELADDYSGILPVIQDAIRRTGILEGCVVPIYATVPMLKGCDIRAAYLIWTQSGQGKILISAAKYGYPVFRSFTCDDGGGAKMLFPECYGMRSQDLPEVYHDAALFYMAEANEWLNSAAIYRKETLVLKVNHQMVCDIDTEDDWCRAESLYKLALSDYNGSSLFPLGRGA